MHNLRRCCPSSSLTSTPDTSSMRLHRCSTGMRPLRTRSTDLPRLPRTCPRHKENSSSNRTLQRTCQARTRRTALRQFATSTAPRHTRNSWRRRCRRGCRGSKRHTWPIRSHPSSLSTRPRGNLCSCLRRCSPGTSQPRIVRTDWPRCPRTCPRCRGCSSSIQMQKHNCPPHTRRTALHQFATSTAPRHKRNSWRRRCRRGCRGSKRHTWPIRSHPSSLSTRPRRSSHTGLLRCCQLYMIPPGNLCKLRHQSPPSRPLRRTRRRLKNLPHSVSAMRSLAHTVCTWRPPKRLHTSPQDIPNSCLKRLPPLGRGRNQCNLMMRPRPCSPSMFPQGRLHSSMRRSHWNSYRRRKQCTRQTMRRLTPTRTVPLRTLCTRLQPQYRRRCRRHSSRSSAYPMTPRRRLLRSRRSL